MKQNIGFKITVEFYCPEMIDEQTFKEEYNSDPVAAYKSISSNFQDSPMCFSSDDKIVKIEVAK